jgi:hypothetical protein
MALFLEERNDDVWFKVRECFSYLHGHERVGILHLAAFFKLDHKKSNAAVKSLEAIDNYSVAETMHQLRRVRWSYLILVRRQDHRNDLRSFTLLHHVFKYISIDSGFITFSRWLRVPHARFWYHGVPARQINTHTLQVVFNFVSSFQILINILNLRGKFSKVIAMCHTG